MKEITQTCERQICHTCMSRLIAEQGFSYQVLGRKTWSYSGSQQCGEGLKRRFGLQRLVCIPSKFPCQGLSSAMQKVSQYVVSLYFKENVTKPKEI